MKRAEYYTLLKEQYTDIDTFSDILHTFRRIEQYVEPAENVLVSVSGGSDSDCIVHILCKYFPEYLYKCFFVFVDTGLEYKATKQHLKDLESKYGITIDRIRGKSVVWAVREYGIPLLNKCKARKLSQYLKGTPKGEYVIFEKESKIFGFTEKERELALYCKANGIRVSEKCCDVSKKKPLHEYAKQNHIDLTITGERKAEGGIRATVYKGCFSERNLKFMPLYWWSNRTKEIFKAIEHIRYSDCYEVYGMKRTGCCGCPFGRNKHEELMIMKTFEPELFSACMKVFGEAYRLTDQFHVRKGKILDEIPDP